MPCIVSLSSTKVLAYVSVFAISFGLSVLVLPQAFASTAIALALGAVFFCILQDNSSTSTTTAATESVSSSPVPVQRTATNETAVMSPLPPRAPSDNAIASPPEIITQDNHHQLAKNPLSDPYSAWTMTPSTLAASASPRSDVSANSQCVNEHVLLSIVAPTTTASTGSWQQCDVAFSCQTYWKLVLHPRASSPLLLLHNSPIIHALQPAKQNTTELQFTSPPSTDLPIAPCLSHADVAISTASEWSRVLHDFTAAVPHHISILESFVSCEVQSGYVEQISPDCAAAAAAGAINALLSIPADSPQTQSQHAALKAYVSMFHVAKDAAVCRMNKALAKERDAHVIVEHVLQLSSKFSSAWSTLSAASLRKQLVHAMHPDAAAAAETSEQQPRASSDLAVFAQKLSCVAPWSDLFVANLKTIIKADAAIAKLTAERPSTAPISNKKLSLCVRGAAAAAGFAVQASTFFSKKPCSNSRHLVSANDSEETMQEQWQSLKLAVQQPNTVLLFHLRNHYAIIAGHRTLRLPCGEILQQLLCARKGQCPKHWIDFRCSWMEGDIPRWSVRDTLLKWIGYKIVMVKRARAGFVDKDVVSVAAVADAFASWAAENGAAAEFRGTDGDNVENGPCESEAGSEEEDTAFNPHENKDEEGIGLHLKVPRAFRGLKGQITDNKAGVAETVCAGSEEMEAVLPRISGIDAAVSIRSAKLEDMREDDASAPHHAANVCDGQLHALCAATHNYDCARAESFDAHGACPRVVEHEPTAGDEMFAPAQAVAELTDAKQGHVISELQIAECRDWSTSTAAEPNARLEDGEEAAALPCPACSIAGESSGSVCSCSSGKTALTDAAPLLSESFDAHGKCEVLVADAAEADAATEAQASPANPQVVEHEPTAGDEMFAPAQANGESAVAAPALLLSVASAEISGCTAGADAAEADAATEAQASPANPQVVEHEPTAGDEMFAPAQANGESAVAAPALLLSVASAEISGCTAGDTTCAGVEPIGLFQTALSGSASNKGVAPGGGKAASNAASGRVRFGVANIDLRALKKRQLASTRPTQEKENAAT